MGTLPVSLGSNTTELTNRGFERLGNPVWPTRVASSPSVRWNCWTTAYAAIFAACAWPAAL